MLVLPLHQYGVKVTVGYVMWGNVVYLPHNEYRVLRILSQNSIGCWAYNDIARAFLLSRTPAARRAL